jgi:hypothetical protein
MRGHPEPTAKQNNKNEFKRTVRRISREQEETVRSSLSGK